MGVVQEFYTQGHNVQNVSLLLLTHVNNFVAGDILHVSFPLALGHMK